MKITYILFLSLCLLLFPNSISAERPSLQVMIDEAEAGGTLIIPPGYYEENIAIDKPLNLIGERDVTINSCENAPVVAISGDGVQLGNVSIEQCNEDNSELAAVYVTGDQHHLSNLKIQSSQMGLQLFEANQIVVEESAIMGTRKENGIDLWKTNDSTIREMKIDTILDGIYMEQSHRNTIVQNVIENARYGIHLMFTNDTVIEENQSQHNFTGAMVMEAENVLIKNNDFSFNNQNVNSQGLLLYLTSDVVAENNVFASNRVGAFIEDSSDATISKNIFQSNTIGAQWKNSSDNQLVSNTFNGNVNDTQANESANNIIINNYWDAALKLDIDGDGVSELPHAADPYFMALVQRIPEYQLFFQHPGITLLKQVFNGPEDELLRDLEPSMVYACSENGQKNEKQIVLWFVGVAFIFVNLLIIQKWRRTT
ncbi:right-handed parallel beta-helix repeat-containing protein [Cytobacillus gottheilii]|uniref:right-handed parallel beta-helix repeat-containing protein n=1 Tax=Cytobacillus gottheilii TaxID=859144 RepID=UPI0009BC7242|nr:right-handed parallel beta-helix repeat-containing protein [Cytobacillus gottheilii]